MSRIVPGIAGVCILALAIVGMPTAHARGEGDTHIYGTGQQVVVDCNDSTLFVNGSWNTISATGTCFAVTMQGSGNTVIADTVLNDITVYGWDQTVCFKFGEPFINDIGRQLGMTNRIDRIPG